MLLSCMANVMLIRLFLGALLAAKFNENQVGNDTKAVITTAV